MVRQLHRNKVPSISLYVHGLIDDAGLYQRQLHSPHAQRIIGTLSCNYGSVTKSLPLVAMVTDVGEAEVLKCNSAGLQSL